MATNIKISELNGFPFPHPIAPNDFFPLVDSSSMTTYRVGVAEIAGALTASGQAIGANFASGALFASRSISASHADVADNVWTKGNFRAIPFWNTPNTPGANGALNTYSPLYVSYSGLAWEGILMIESSSFTYPGGVPNPIDRPDYVVTPWFNYRNNTFNGNPIYGASGIWSAYPIVSAYFVGTDNNYWSFSTANNPPSTTNLFWSGSSKDGWMATIPAVQGGLSASFNGKWVRLACASGFGGTFIASGSSFGESPNGTGGFFGRIRLSFGTSNTAGASNSQQIIDLDVHDSIWGGGLTAQVRHSSFYGYDHIRKLRLSIWTPRSSINSEKIFNDPMMAFDIFIDKLTDMDNICSLQAQSWGGLRFNKIPNVDPPPLYDTGSSQYGPYNTTGYFDPKTATYLIFPACPGYYSSLGDSQYGAQGAALQPYRFVGKKVQIDPNRNLVTESAWWQQPDLNYKPYTLFASGSISTQKYYAEDSEGQSGILVAYDGVTSQWKNLVYKSGILIDSSSVATPPIAGGGSGTPNSALSASYASHSTWAETASYVDPSLNPGIPRAWALCVCTSSTTLPVSPAYHVPGIDWHWWHVMSGYNVRAVTKESNATLGPHPVDFPLSPNDTSGPVSQATLADPYQGAGANRHWLVTLNTTMSNTNYMVMGGGGGEQGSEYIHMTMFPQSKRTNTQFTLSMCDGNADFQGPTKVSWFTFAVYENPLNIGLSYPGWPIVTS